MSRNLLIQVLLPLLVFSASTLERNITGGAGPSLFVVPLDKQYVPVMRGNTTVMHKTAYFGTVYVGSPEMQAFSVVFDTGSGHFFLPSDTCTTAACMRHRRYKRSLSQSVKDIDADGALISQPSSDALERDKVQIQFGTGQVEGEFVQELACLSNHTGEVDIAQRDDCAMVRVITATDMTDEPFGEFQFDGVVGLGLESLALHSDFSFFGQIARLGRLPTKSFSVFVSRHDSVASEIAFGGHDERRIGEALQWAPVVRPELGYWQVNIKSISVGNETLPWCDTGGCSAVLDTGTSLLGVPRKSLQDFHWLLARILPEAPAGSDCRNSPGPNITFSLGDFNLTLGPEDYSRPKPLQINNTKANRSQIVCRASLLPVDMSESLGARAFILGEPVLRKYYTTYDWGRQQIGFAAAVQPNEPLHSSVEPPRHNIYGSSTSELTPTAVRI